MLYSTRMWRALWIALLLTPLSLFAATPVKSMVIFGDSFSDTGNTTHLMKSLRQDENPAYLVNPLKVFVINKMTEYANDYYVPQMVLDAGLGIVTTFFDDELGPMLATLIGRVRLVPLIPGEPYWQAHFSNGRVWNEYLAPMLNVDREDQEHFTNKAFGGSWAATYDYQLTVWNLIRHPLLTLKTLIVGKLIPPSLGLVVQAHLLIHEKLDNRTVYFVFSGANDYLNVLNFEDNYNPAVMTVYIDNVINSVTSAVTKLTNAGAKRIVLIGVPPIGNTPKFIHTMDRPILNEAVKLHNERLARKVDEWKTVNPDVDFLYIDVKPFFQEAQNNPRILELTNTTDACIDVKFSMWSALTKSPFAGNSVLEYSQVLQYRDHNFAPHERNYHVCDRPKVHLYWDEVHPSTRVHHYLAYRICEAMKAHGYTTSCKAPPAKA